MRFTAAFLRVISLGTLILACVSVQGQQASTNNNKQSAPRTYMSDPFFGIGYNVRNVHFEDAPPALRQHCRGLRRWKHMWIYAAWKAADADYYIVSGLLSDGTLDPETDGLTVKIHGAICAVDQPDWILSGSVNPYVSHNPIGAAPEVVNGLATDLLRRYTEAFGGKAEFLRAVRQTRSFSPSTLPNVVRSQFEQFAKSP